MWQKKKCVVFDVAKEEISKGLFTRELFSLKSFPLPDLSKADNKVKSSTSKGQVKAAGPNCNRSMCSIVYISAFQHG